MGRLGTFVPRLVALTAVWLLATTALTYAAAQRMNTPTVTPTTPATTTTVAPTVLVVPDVRHQAYVFAKGSLGDAGFGWRVAGAVEGYPANTVVSQTPAPGTRVIDTGAPLIVLHLERAAGKQEGLPEMKSAIRGTRVRLADLAVQPVSVPKTTLTTPAKVATPKRAPVKRPAPEQKRPPAFVVAGARREPLNEIPLTARAAALFHWVGTHPKASDANVKYWLYQHAWIVTGAKMGWWRGESALQTLIVTDERVWDLWGVGAVSKAQAQAALVAVRAHAAG